MSMNLTLNGISIKEPRPGDFTIQKFNLTKSGRTAAGKMKMEFIAKKRKFKFKYQALTGTDLETILGVIDTTQMFFTLGYLEDGVSKSATVYVGEIAADKFRTDGVWVWKNVTFDLIEQ